MQCPTDNTPLQMSSRNGIEIDYCPKCRGVWLDRGELDKLIEREQGSYGAPQQANDEHYGNQSTEPRRAYRDDDDDEEHYGRQDHQSNDQHNQHGQQHHRKKKEGFLGDLFDF